MTTPTRWILLAALAAWLGFAGWFAVWMLDDLTSDTKVTSHLTISSSTPAGPVTLTRDSAVTVSGPLQATVTNEGDPLAGVTAAVGGAGAASSAAPGGTEDGSSTAPATSTAPASTATPASAAPDGGDGGGGGGGPAVTTGTGDGSLVTLAAFVLLIGAGLLALLLRDLTPQAGTAQPAVATSSVAERSSAMLDAAARARDAADRATTSARADAADLTRVHAERAAGDAREAGAQALELAAVLERERQSPGTVLGVQQRGEQAIDAAERVSRLPDDVPAAEVAAVAREAADRAVETARHAARTVLHGAASR